MCWVEQGYLVLALSKNALLYYYYILWFINCSTPPPRLDAFEEFKQDLGSEIYRILTENKDILNNKKKAYATLAEQINKTKMEIDESKARLQELQLDRESAGKSMCILDLSYWSMYNIKYFVDCIRKTIKCTFTNCDILVYLILMMMRMLLYI